jgi:hypothetical protein
VLSLLLAGCAGSGPAPTGSPSGAPTGSAPPAARTISGEIHYAGNLLDGHAIVIVANRASEPGPPAYSAKITAPGPYSLTDVADGTYLITAFIDLGDDMGAPQANEPAGAYDVAGDGTPDLVEIAGGSAVTTVDIILADR